MMFGGYTGAPEGAEERLLAAAQWERDAAMRAKALREAADVDDTDHVTEVALGGLDYVQDWLRHRADLIERPHDR